MLSGTTSASLLSVLTANRCVPGLADSRKSLFDYDQVLNTQRDKVYAIRRQALLSDDLSGLMLDFSGRTMDDILEVCLSLRHGPQIDAWLTPWYMP